VGWLIKPKPTKSLCGSLVLSPMRTIQKSTSFKIKMKSRSGNGATVLGLTEQEVGAVIQDGDYSFRQSVILKHRVGSSNVCMYL
jgi:hypothetical protein